jgi:hypothetical protein
MRQSYRLVGSGSNRQIAALTGSEEMNGLRTSPPALGLWWRSGAALSAALAVDADVTDNRRLAFVVALCAALIVYAGAAVAGQRTRG